MQNLKKPLFVVPQGIKDLFLRTARGATVMYEIREIDPAHPGFPEFEALLRGDDDYDSDEEDKGPDIAEYEHSGKQRPAIRLVWVQAGPAEP